MKRKLTRRINSLLNSGDLYFIILCILLMPAIYFIVAGCEWSIWTWIPRKYEQLFLDGDDLLYDIGLAYAGGFIFYLLVDYMPNKRRIKIETESFIDDMQQYMFIMSSAIQNELDMPSSFYLKLYSRPKEPQVFYKRKKWKYELDVFYTNYRDIENNYWSYRGYEDKGHAMDKVYLNEIKTELDRCSENYRICANRLSVKLGLIEYKK